MDDQDWDTIVFKKRKHKTDNAQKVNKDNIINPTISKVTNTPAWKIEKQIDNSDDNVKPIKYVSKEDANKIIHARFELKLSQKDLAKQLNMQVKDIQDIETCKAVENKSVLSRIKRHLKI
jgi:ribosome-binding protein aMBF1 (putative translation factor)